MRLASVVIAAVVVSSLARAHAGSAAAIAVPPVEVDTGIGSTIGRAAAVAGPTTELLAGLHWASLYWKPTPFDFGVGYVGVARDLVPPDYIARDTMAPADHRLRLDGMYIDVAYAIERHPHWRTWVAGRAEFLSASTPRDGFYSHGFALRIATEVYSSTVGAAGGGNAIGIVAGTFALGFYVEASHRDLPPELGPDAMTAGFSLRLPFILGAAG